MNIIELAGLMAWIVLATIGLLVSWIAFKRFIINKEDFGKELSK